MSATTTNTNRTGTANRPNDEDHLPPTPGRGSWTGVSPSVTNGCCPSCGSIIYARRHARCGVCGHALPKACLFSTVQARQIELLMERERRQHRNWLRRVANA